jgi:hypothetical protein
MHAAAKADTWYRKHWCKGGPFVLRWITIAGTTLVVGGVAWLLKLAVIVATGGRVVDTGAAAVFYLLGFLLLVIGSTGLGLWLTTNRAVPLRIAAVVLSPVAFLASVALLDVIARAAVGGLGPSYVPDEAGVFLAAAVWLVLGAMLVGFARRSRGAVSSQAGQTSRVR